MLAAAGLAFLTLTSAGETGGKSSDYSLAAMLAWEATLVGAGTLLIVMHRQDRHASREGVAVIAVTSIASNASSIPAGIVVFGDPLGEGAPLIALRSLAFLLVVVAAALIPGPARAQEPQAAVPH